MNINDIITLGRRFAHARETLKGIVDNIRERQQAVINEQRAELRKAVNQANTRQAELASAICESPELFEKPRTIVVDGVKLGLGTRKGGITFEDAERTVELIKRKFPVFAETAIRRKEAPDKEALAKWSDEDLARIGAVREPDDTMSVVIRPTDSEVDKLVAALLEDVEDASKELVA